MNAQPHNSVWPVVLGALIVAACPDAPKSPPDAPATRSAAEPKGESGGESRADPHKTGSDGPTAPPPRPATVAERVQVPPGYKGLHLKEVVTEMLQREPIAGHVLDVDYAYRVRTTTVAKGDPTYDIAIRILRVRVDARREDYRARLDSDRPGDLVRVRGGADTAVMFDSVSAFSMFQKPLRLELGPNGDLTRLVGGDAVRASMLSMFPKKPRTEPQTAPLIDVKLSDRKLMERLWPTSTVLPPSGRVAAGRRFDVDEEEDFADYKAKVARATLVSALGADGYRLAVKRFDKPSTTSSIVPRRKNTPQHKLRTGKREMKLDMGRKGPPTFEGGGETDEREIEWEGVLNGETGVYLLYRKRTRIWSKLP